MKKALTQQEIRRRERRKKIRKRRIIISLIFFLLIGIAVFGVLLKTKLFPVKNIKADGSSVYSSAEIIAASGITRKTPIMSISQSQVKKLLSKKLPFIETVTVKCSFPDTVQIKVGDAKEYYCFVQKDDYYSVSEKGHILNKYLELPQNVIEVKASSAKLKVGQDLSFGDNQEKETFELITAAIKEKGITLNSIDITNIVHITMKVENKFEVNLGNKANLKEKIAHLAGMIEGIGDRKGKINLDMWSNSDSKGTFIAEN